MAAGAHPTLDLDARLQRTKGRSARVFSLTTKLSREEAQELEDAATAQGKAVGEWARDALLTAARTPMDNILLTELVGTKIFLLTLLKRMALGTPTTEADYSQIAKRVQTEKVRAARELISLYTKKQDQES